MLVVSRHGKHTRDIAMSTDIDLRQLARQREAAPAPRRRHLVARYLLPAAVLLGFLAALAWAARDSLLPAQPVTVVPVLSSRTELGQQEGTPLFQAAGWVEPRPTPVVITALAEGVVAQLLVVEGQEVQEGEPVAQLIDAEARLAVQAAEADRKLRQAELAGAKGTLAGARLHVTQPVHLEAVLAEADAALAKTETELANLPFQLRAAEARLQLVQRDFEAKKKALAGGSISDVSFRTAESEFEMARAAAEELKARGPRLQREAEALTRKRDALRKQLELKAAEACHLVEAEANVQAAEAKVEQARVAEAAARLRLERMTVRAPCAGRVLALIARPGMRLMGLAQGSLQESSSVVTLYDPRRLQVRADVRFDDVPRVRPGQPVRVESPAAPGGPLGGEVLFATSAADIQKNTLQFKVAIHDPPPTLKPDMLVQVTFLAPPGQGAPQGESEPLQLLVPRQLVEAGDGGAHVWVADQAAGVARRRAVKLGVASGDLVAVVEGLSAADKLISGGREGLKDGQRVRVTGEDAALGVEGRGATPRLPRR